MGGGWRGQSATVPWLDFEFTNGRFWPTVADLRRCIKSAVIWGTPAIKLVPYEVHSKQTGPTELRH